MIPPVTRRHFLKTAATAAAQVSLVPHLARSAQNEAASPDPLWAIFQEPPAEAKASCYWWWKGKLAPGEMSRQLRVLKTAGLGGAHIIPWGSTPAYLSPPWLELMREAADAAKQEGMLLDMSANATWPFRGSWVPLEESLTKVEVARHLVEGPMLFSLPAKTAAPKSGKAKGAESGEGSSRILLAQLAPESFSHLEQLRDVTTALTQKGSTGVAVPAGKHTLYVLRETREVKGQSNLGRVPDHFNPRAIENYLKGFAERVAPAVGGKLSNAFRAMYCDSIEISEANWTPQLPEEFRRRCGYDFLPYLPLVLGVDAKDQLPLRGKRPLDRIVERVRYDYCRVLVDLFLESLGRTFYRWCHDNGTLCRWQAYGWPLFYGIEDGYRIPDMPEGNSWLFSPPVFNFDTDVHGWPVWQKYTSSGAHQAGRRIASTEAFTVVEGKFKETLDLVKRQDDFNFICGINHSFLHGFCYSPAGEPFPGRDQYGTYFSEHNPWWSYFPRWTEYNARLSGVFQASQPVAQVALLFRTSDVWAQAGLHRHPFQMDPPWAHQVWRWINQNGANADYVSDQLLQQAKFERGQLVFGPARYAALLVLATETILPATAAALDRYARAGGKIVFVGTVPEASPGLRDAEANDRKVRETCQRLLRDLPKHVMRREAPGAESGGKPAAWVEVMNRWRKSASDDTCLSWADQLLTDLQVRRSVRFDQPVPGLYHIHRQYDEKRNLYFFSNTTESELVARAVFPDASRRIERWDPETASRFPFALGKDHRALLVLPPGGSLLLVASEGEAFAAPESGTQSAPVKLQEIDGPWSVSFKPAKGDAFEVSPFELAGLHLSSDERLNRFAGQAIFRRRFDCSVPAGRATVLDLGLAPNCITEVHLNGRALGVRWYGRHVYALEGALREGSNELVVTVVTTLFNGVRKDTEKAEPSGLIGAVTLRGANL